MPSGKAFSNIDAVGVETTADGSDAATTQALANALKARFNTFIAAFDALVVEMKDRGNMEDSG